jgi:hypothetical protein
LRCTDPLSVRQSGQDGVEALAAAGGRSKASIVQRQEAALDEAVQRRSEEIFGRSSGQRFEA